MSSNHAVTTSRLAAPVIVLSGGGSGGHLTPILSLAHALKKQSPDCRVIYIGIKGEKLPDLIKSSPAIDQVFRVSAGKWRRYHGRSLVAKLLNPTTLLLNIRDSFRVLAGSLQAYRLLGRINPSVVFSKGGYGAVPVGVAAKWRHLPIVTHDSDSLPGLANRLIGRWAVIHATGQADGDYPYPAASIRHTGIPVNQKLKPVTAQAQQLFKQQLKIPSGQPVILVGGAGLGSRTLNQLMISSAASLLTQHPKLHILHLTGKDHLSACRQAYGSQLTADVRRRLHLADFTNDFQAWSGAADLIVTRAGATTLAELAVQHKACIVIPAPWLAEGHQTRNAQKLQAAGAAAVADNHISANDFISLINRLLADPKRRQALADKLGALAKPEAADQLASLILNSAQIPR
ncbi:glycosyltransferase [Candidatus Saccharibacteria bacterium]|nr:glycosyltransferase [Candidatus Saccharibacteria bacterium]